MINCVCKCDFEGESGRFQDFEMKVLAVEFNFAGNL